MVDWVIVIDRCIDEEFITSDSRRKPVWEGGGNGVGG